jgi:hypothetical protein
LTCSDVVASDISALYRDINEGALGDVRSAAWSAIRHIEQREAHNHSVAGGDGSDLDEVNPARAAAEAVYDDEFFARRHADTSGERFMAMSCAHDAAVAISYKQYVGDRDYPRFTQEAYEHLTRPWHQIFDGIGAEPGSAAESWARRPLTPETVAGLSSVSRNLVEASEHAASHSRKQ